MESVHGIRTSAMRKRAAIFFQVLVVLIAIAALALLLWEPTLEGRNAHATLFQVYFNDPFLAYAYTGSLALFAALYQAFKLLGYIGRGELFSQPSVKAVRTIKYCALTLVAFLLGAEAYFFIVRRSEDDIAGGVMMGLFLILVFVALATAAAASERALHNAVGQRLQNA